MQCFAGTDWPMWPKMRQNTKKSDPEVQSPLKPLVHWESNPRSTPPGPQSPQKIDTAGYKNFLGRYDYLKTAKIIAECVQPVRHGGPNRRTLYDSESACS